VARQKSTRTSLVQWALLVTAALLLPDSVRAAERPYEIGGAVEEVARIRELSERLSKQNLFYQLHLADQEKQDLHDTSAELDRSLDLLREGSVAYSVIAPPTDEIRVQIAEVDKAWGPVRRMALASPYDYLRRANEFMPRRSRLGDPLFIRSFDQMVQTMLAEVDRLMELYRKECLKTDYELCDLASTRGLPVMLTERAVKDLVFVYTGPGDKHDRDALRKTRDAIDALNRRFDEEPVLQESRDPARGDAGLFVASLWSSVKEDWSRMRREVDLAISGRSDEINLKKVLEVQDRLVETYERLTVITVRYADAKYAP
jgi:hypothetical protein